MTNVLKVCVVDMQPITPAVGGGRQRLLGLYHALGDGVNAVYVGTYDWPGESFRDHQITPGLREICVPLSAAHHRAAQEAAERYGGRVAIDMEFHLQVHLSPDYIDIARREIEKADVVVFSHPWCFPPLKHALRDDQLVVYDSHNVEAFLRYQLHADVPEMQSTLREIAAVEGELLDRSDLVYCCSDEEVELYQSIFMTPLSKLRVAPNGTFLHSTTPPGSTEFDAESPKRRMESGSRPLVAFMGSQYGPNAEAGSLIVDRLAPALPDVDFVIIGGLAEVLRRPDLAPNVILTGVISDEDKRRWLCEADFAINPMLSGAGTNVKMFNFLAAGLPVITTLVGARGIVSSSTADGAVEIVAVEAMVAAIAERIGKGVAAHERAAAIALVDRRFNNSKISCLLGRELLFHSRGVGVPRPKVAIFSTWGMACGIAEHARYLAEGFRESGVDPIILANHVAHHVQVGFEGDLQFPVTRCWHWDNLRWCDSTVDSKAFERVIEREKPDLLVVEHHSAFLQNESWVQMLRTAARKGVPVIFECHDARSVPEGDLLALAKENAVIVVHSEVDQSRLSGNRVASLVVPLGVRGRVLPKQQRDAGVLVIGGFGFYRAHKGIDTVLEALEQVARLPGMPRLAYRGWHAFYPGEENSDYVLKCNAIAARIADSVDVEIRTHFIDIDEAIASLSACDLIALAYAPSREGGSASAGAALASGAPILCTPSGIFEDLEDAAFRSDGFGLEHFSQALGKMLASPALRDEYAARSARLAKKRSYQSVAMMIYSAAQH